MVILISTESLSVISMGIVSLTVNGLLTLSESSVPLLLITPVTVEAPMVAELLPPSPVIPPSSLVMLSTKPGW